MFLFIIKTGLAYLHDSVRLGPLNSHAAPRCAQPKREREREREREKEREKERKRERKRDTQELTI